MSLTHRVHRLEADRGESPCPECGGNPPLLVSKWHEGDAEPVPTPCPTCGDYNHIVLRYVRKSIIDPCTMRGMAR